jgi:hypothetical protein
MQPKPKSHKEIQDRNKYSKRRYLQTIEDDIFAAAGIGPLNRSYKRKQLSILIHELAETATHEGASNPYC